MRFVCDSCRAQYMISDDKVGAKGVKVRCKKCGFVILVRRTEPAAELAETQVMTAPLTESPPAPASGAAPGEDSPFGGGDDALFAGADDEIGAVFDQVLGGGSPPPSDEQPSMPPDEDEDEIVQTRVVDLNTMQRLAAETTERDEDDQTQVEAAPAAAAHEWYAAIDDKQQGPFSLEKMKELCGRGELGPDSLCWRAGFSDWLPLSEISELTSVLAPRPAKPVISAATSVAPASSAVVDTGDSDAGDPDGGSDWQPSAASALASLVKDEIEALTRPAAKAPANDLAGSLLGGGLLDKPAPAPAATSPGLIPSVPPSEEEAPAPARAPYPAPVMESAPAPARAAPFVPAPYAQGGGGLGSKKALMIGLSVGGVVVVALLITVVYLLGKGSGEDRNPQPVAMAQPVQLPAKAPAQTPPPPAQAAAQPASAPAQAAAQPTPAEAKQAPAPEPAKAEVAKAEVAKAEVAKADPPETTHHVRRTRRTSTRDREEAVRDTPPPEPKQERSSGGGSGDAFDAIFGGGGGDSQPSAKRESPRHKSVYVPPAPGSADLPDELSQGDIMQVVLAHKPAIAKCVQQQKANDPNLSGRMVVRWTILTSGRTSGVAVRTSEFRSTKLASCISGLIRTMRFPRHKQQGAPIDFPFTF